MTPPADLSALVAELRTLIADTAGHFGGGNIYVAPRKLTVLLAAAEERDALRAALETLRKAGEEAVYALTCGDRQADVLDVFCEKLGDAEKALGRGT